MAKTHPQSAFAAIPERAIGDARLNGSHWRALAAIALHDRLSARRKQGAGCYASNKTLSERSGLNYTNFSTIVRELGLWGYIVSTPHPINRRTRVYRVIYDEAGGADGLPTDKLSSDETPSNGLPTGKVLSQSDDAEAKPASSANDTLPTGEQSAEIVCPPIQQPHETTQQPNDIYIPLSGNKSCETERYSPEGAPILGEGLRKRRADDHDGKYLAIVERALRDDGLTLTTSDEKQVLAIMDGREPGDKLYHQAERILANWGEAG
jgi:hypothetical protein